MKYTKRLTDIAVIGIGFRLPSVKNKKALNEMLEKGNYSKSGLAGERGELLGISDYENFLGNIRCLDKIQCFDNSFFRIVKQEAIEMPPEIRFALMCAGDAVMDAGYSLKMISGRRCGAVVAHGRNSYRNLLSRTTFLSFFNNMPGMTCGYMSHYLKLNGPVYFLDSTCSSSLTAVANACNHLIMGQADYMLAGGVQICLPVTQQESKEMASPVLSLSSGQRCIPFDHNANGFYNSEGAGFLLMERLDDAIKNGDHIYGVIKGYGMYSNSDLCQTIYAPSAEGLYCSASAAWKMAGITADELTEFEAHGAATRQGDAAEIENLKFLLKNRKVKTPVYLTAVKSNFGHTVCAAGVTSLIKVLLGFENHVIYPIAGFEKASEYLNIDESKIMPLSNVVRIYKHKRRIADICSYGLNELNVNMILESPPLRDSVRHRESPKFLKCSAKSEAVLRQYLNLIGKQVARTCELDFDDLIMTLNSGRDDFQFRCLLRFHNQSELVKKLEQYLSIPIVKCKPIKELLCTSEPTVFEQGYLRGMEPDWDLVYKDMPFRKIPAVTYPYDEISIWPEKN